MGLFNTARWFAKGVFTKRDDNKIDDNIRTLTTQHAYAYIYILNKYCSNKPDRTLPLILSGKFSWFIYTQQGLLDEKWIVDTANDVVRSNSGMSQRDLFLEFLFRFHCWFFTQQVPPMLRDSITRELGEKSHVRALEYDKMMLRYKNGPEWREANDTIDSFIQFITSDSQQ